MLDPLRRLWWIVRSHITYGREVMCLTCANTSPYSETRFGLGTQEQNSAGEAQSEYYLTISPVACSAPLPAALLLTSACSAAPHLSLLGCSPAPPVLLLSCLRLLRCSAPPPARLLQSSSSPPARLPPPAAPYYYARGTTPSALGCQEDNEGSWSVGVFFATDRIRKPIWKRGCRLRSDRSLNLVQRYLLNVIEARRGEERRGEASRGEERRGEVRRGEERRGKVRGGEERRGETRRGEERRGEASRGEARRGEERRGEERRGGARRDGRGEDRRGEARRARRGEARQDAERELARVNFSTRQNFSN
ncbi:hypothetical protein ACLB2K_032089 [Fragaria x ananassa]